MCKEIFDKKGNVHYFYDMWDCKRKRVSYTNSKTGFPSINLLAGDKNKVYNGCVPETLKDTFNVIGGTCPYDCPGCYAKKITRNYEPAIKFALNTLEAKTDPERFWYMVEYELFKWNQFVTYKIIRTHDSGDFFNDDYFETGMKFIKKHEDSTRFYGYTKAKDTVENYGIDNLPDNFGLLCSPWGEICKPIGDLPQFIYDDGTNPELVNISHCPAIDRYGKKTGIKCKDCLWCPLHAKKGGKKAVYAH